MNSENYKKMEIVNNLLSLIKQRNSFFIKFKNLNDNKLEKVRNGNFRNLKLFYDTRSKLLKHVEKLDSEIRSFAKTCPSKTKNIPVLLKKSLTKALDRKEELIKEILEQDLELINYVNEYQLKSNPTKKSA